jgi:hypothetical protein
LLFLSSGEKTLAQFMAEVGKKTKAGQETRMADIPADAGAGYGVFECLHGHSIASDFAIQISKVVPVFYGAPGIEWLRLLTKHYDSLESTIEKRIDDLCSRMIPQSANGQVQRVGRRFALVAAAGEMATAAGLRSSSTRSRSAAVSVISSAARSGRRARTSATRPAAASAAADACIRGRARAGGAGPSPGVRSGARREQQVAADAEISTQPAERQC